MNFNQIRQAMGQVGQDGYTVKVAMVGNLDSVEAVKFNEKSGKRTQQVWITDSNAEQCRVKIMLGNNPDLTPHMAEKHTFSIAAYVSNYDGQTYYSGFCNLPKAAQAPPQGPNAPQGQQPYPQQPKTQQAPPQAARQQEVEKQKKEYEQKENERQSKIMRQHASTDALTYLGLAGKAGPFEFEEVVMWAERFFKYYKFGSGGMPNPDYVGGPKPQDDDDDDLDF